MLKKVKKKNTESNYSKLKAINSWGQFFLLLKMGEKLQLISRWEAHCLSTHLYSGSFLCFYSPFYVRSWALRRSLWWQRSLALAGSRWLVMKNSVQSLTRETRRRRVAVGSRRKSKEKRRGEMRGRWEMSEEGDKGGGCWGRRKEGNEKRRRWERREEDGSQSSTRTSRRASESSPQRCSGARQRIRAVSPLRLGLLHGDNTPYESFMRGAFLLITHTHTLCPASFIHFALFFLLPGGYSSERWWKSRKQDAEGRRQRRLYVGCWDQWSGERLICDRPGRSHPRDDAHTGSWNVRLVTCPHVSPRRKLTPPRGLWKSAHPLAFVPIWLSVRDGARSRWIRVNRRRVCECREGTERLVSVGGADWLTDWLLALYRSSAQRGTGHKHPHTENTSQLFTSKIVAKL